MNYPQLFARLIALLSTVDASAELLVFVNRVANAPIWNDDDALRVIADATEKINHRIEDGGVLGEIVRDCRILQDGVLVELRGE